MEMMVVMDQMEVIVSLRTSGSSTKARNWWWRWSIYNPPNFAGRPGGCGGGASSYPDRQVDHQRNHLITGTDYGQLVEDIKT